MKRSLVLKAAQFHAIHRIMKTLRRDYPPLMSTSFKDAKAAAYQVLVKQRSQKEVRKEFNITESCLGFVVGRLIEIHKIVSAYPSAAVKG